MHMGRVAHLAEKQFIVCLDKATIIPALWLKQKKSVNLTVKKGMSSDL